MSPDSISKLKLNLNKFNCGEFRITTEVELEESLARDLGLDTKRKFKRLYEEYTRNHISHSISLRFARRENQTNRYAVRILYETVEPKELGDWFSEEPTKLKPTEAFLELCKIDTTFFFRCDCLFYYRKGESDVYFQLPIKLDGDLFDEIRGVKLVKMEQNNILWQNSVDLIETNMMTHRVRFAQEGYCSLDLPLKLLMRARDISIRT